MKALIFGVAGCVLALGPLACATDDPRDGTNETGYFAPAGTLQFALTGAAEVESRAISNPVLAPAPVHEAEFGSSVSFSEDLLAIASRGEGRVNLYRASGLDGDIWEPAGILQVSPRSGETLQGKVVVADGRVAVASNRSVYIFEQSPRGSWIRNKVWSVPTDPDAWFADFGFDGRRLVVLHDTTRSTVAENDASVDVFVRQADGSWDATQETLTDMGQGMLCWRAGSIAVRDDLLAISCASGIGVPHTAGVWTRDGAAWSYQGGLAYAYSGNEFGVSLAVMADTVVVSAAKHEENPGSPDVLDNEGALFVYTPGTNGWANAERTMLLSPKREEFASFGGRIAVDGDRIMVGVPGLDRPGTDGSEKLDQATGGVFVFKRAGTAWVTEGFLLPANVDSSLRFGSSVAVQGDLFVIGAPGYGLPGAPVGPQGFSLEAPGAVFIGILD